MLFVSGVRASDFLSKKSLDGELVYWGCVLIKTVLEIVKLVDRNKEMASSERHCLKGLSWESVSDKRVCYPP